MLLGIKKQENVSYVTVSYVIQYFQDRPVSSVIRPLHFRFFKLDVSHGQPQQINNEIK